MERKDEDREKDCTAPNIAKLTVPPTETANQQHPNSNKPLSDRNVSYKISQTSRPANNDNNPTENNNNQCMTQQDPNVVYTNRDENTKSDSSFRTRYWYPNNSGGDFKYAPTQHHRQKRQLGYTPSPIERQYYEFRERQMASIYSSECNTNNTAKYNYRIDNKSHNISDKKNSKQLGISHANYEYVPKSTPNSSMNMYYNYPKMLSISYENSNNTCYGIEGNQLNAIDEFEEISIAIKRVTIETVYQTSNPFFRNPSPEEWVVKLLEVDKEFKKQFRYPDRSIWNSPYYVQEQLSGEPLYMFFDEDFKIWNNPPPAARDTCSYEEQADEAFNYQPPKKQIDEAWGYQLPKDHLNKACSYYQLHDVQTDETCNYQQPKTQADEAWRYQLPLVDDQFNKGINKTCRYQLPGERFYKPCSCQLPPEQYNKAYKYQLSKEQLDESYRYQLPKEQLNKGCSYQIPKEQVNEACGYQLTEEQIDRQNQNYFRTSKPQEFQYWNGWNQNQQYVKPVYYYCNYNRHSQEVLPVFYYYNLPCNFYPMSSFKPELEYLKQNQTTHYNSWKYPAETSMAQSSVALHNNNNTSVFEKSEAENKSAKPTDWTQGNSKTQNMNEELRNKPIDQKFQVNFRIINSTNTKNSKIMSDKNDKTEKLPERNVNEPLATDETVSANLKISKEKTNHKNRKSNKENDKLDTTKKTPSKTRIFNSKESNVATSAIQSKSSVNKSVEKKNNNTHKVVDKFSKII